MSEYNARHSIAQNIMANSKVEKSQPHSNRQPNELSGDNFSDNEPSVVSKVPAASADLMRKVKD